MSKLKPKPIKSGNMPDRIIAARKAMGASPQRIADKLEISRVTLVQWENGQTEPGIAMLEHLAKALGVTPEWLAFGVKSDEKS